VRTAGDADVFAKQGHALAMLSFFVAAFRAGWRKCVELVAMTLPRTITKITPTKWRQV